MRLPDIGQGCAGRRLRCDQVYEQLVLDAAAVFDYCFGMTALDANKQLALRFLKSLATGPEFDLLASDARWWIQGHGFLNLEEFRALLERVAGTKAPSLMTIRHVTAEDDRVAIECDGKGRFLDGRAYENSYHFLFFVRGGKIFEVHEHFDTAYARDVMSGGVADAD